MNPNSTDDQTAASLRWWFSGGILAITLLFIAVAAGIISQGLSETVEAPPSPTPSPTPSSATSPPPSGPAHGVSAPSHELVGQWVGGPGRRPDWILAISADGEYLLLHQPSGQSEEGSVETRDGIFTMYADTGNRRLGEAAAIAGCAFEVQRGAPALLQFCGGGSTFARR